MRKDDRSYFVRRAMEESKAANLAACPQAAAVHRELAERYAQLASAIVTETPEALSTWSRPGAHLDR